jgi:predicted DCC family thiol-disulfide oxidoreductase YuxK
MQQVSQQYPLRIFYDGQCPVCNREIQRHLRHDRLGHLRAIDIAAPDFNATAYGLDAQRVHDVMHVLTADGQVFTEVEAFICIWNALPPRLDRRLMIALLRLPPVRTIADRAYRAFAQNRVRLFGGCDSTHCKPNQAVR